LITLPWFTSLNFKKGAIFDQLRNILKTLYIPLAVKDEYQIGSIKEKEREWILKD